MVLPALTPTSEAHRPPLVTATAVTRRFGPRTVLDAVSLTVAAGERLALMGPSGSGKTTLLNCLGGIDRPDGGEIRLGDESLVGRDSRALAHLRRTRIGTIFQFFHLLPTLTAYENIELSLQLVGVAEPQRRARVTELLERVGLAGLGPALPAELSGGEQQRVAIARALAHRPSLVLADEPTGALDSANGAKVLQLLRELAAAGGPALILVTHSEEAAAICTRRLHLRDGRIVSED